jgi:cell division septal protein FtsQ
LSRKARNRKQRVVLRSKRKSELKQQLETAFLGLLVTGLLGLVMVFMVLRTDGWVPQFIHRHSPMLEIQTPETLVDLPLLKETRPSGFSLWFPGTDWRLRHRWMQQYPAIGNVSFEKRYQENRIVARLEPRIPIVRWQDRGLDKEGTVFPLTSPRWATLPKAVSLQTRTLPLMGPWLSELTRVPELWGQVVAVTQDQRGDLWLDMQTGTHVAWGAPDVKIAREKARCLVLVLEDAHHRLSGASAADLRFFDDGKVIVRPKTAA